MQAPQADPTKDITVQALLVDQPSLTEVEFDLTFSKQGRPFLVFGTGIEPSATEHSLEQANYYFSFTRLSASGTITIDGEEFEVTGTTWMDHEYGYVGDGDSSNRVRWLLQDMQLDNGYSISNANRNVPRGRAAKAVGIVDGIDHSSPPCPHVQENR